MNTLAMKDMAMTQSIRTRCVIEGHEPTVLSNIYQNDCNMVVWRRELNQDLQQGIDEFLHSHSNFQTSMIISPQKAFSCIHQALSGSERVAILSEDISELVDMFCCLFGLTKTGLRLTVLDKAMCPRFHVDKVPCRLVITYQGAATEWLPHHITDRDKLGRGSEGMPDEQSNLFQSLNDIHQLSYGDVALLKGERWTGNEGAGLVHRSPAVLAGERRLLLTLDFS